MPARHYCTYFDHRYLSLGLALYSSMQLHCGEFCLWALCLTNECYEVVRRLALPDLMPLRLSELEAFDEELHAVKQTRATIEYYFTCTPALMRWVFAHNPETDIVTYLDADLFFFKDPGSLFEEFRAYSIFIVPHRYSRRNEHFARLSGNYNVGWVSFRRDKQGLGCLEWWRQSCLLSCSRNNGQCGDQMYLNEFPLRYPNVYVSDDPGANLAPWNLDNYRLSSGPNGLPEVDGKPVIFFHFSQLRRLASFLWRAPYGIFGAPITKNMRKLLFRPYLKEVIAAEKITGYTLPPPTLTHGTTFFRATRSLALIRELAALTVHGGGILMMGAAVPEVVEQAARAIGEDV